MLIDVQICCILSFYFYNLYMMKINVHLCLKHLLKVFVCEWLYVWMPCDAIWNKIK